MKLYRTDDCFFNNKQHMEKRGEGVVTASNTFRRHVNQRHWLDPILVLIFNDSTVKRYF